MLRGFWRNGPGDLPDALGVVPHDDVDPEGLARSTPRRRRRSMGVVAARPAQQGPHSKRDREGAHLTPALPDMTIRYLQADQ